MTIETLVTLGIAVWGAITGTVALWIQMLQHRKDRPILDLTGKMSISASISDNVMRYEIEILVVNKGRRIARINEVCIPAEHFRWILFNTERNVAFDLEEGQAHLFKQRVMNDGMDTAIENLRAVESCTVSLTTGEVFKNELRVVKKSMYEKAMREAKAKSAG